MSRNGSGTYSIPNSFTSGTTITASGHNENNTDIATEITNSVAADGQTSMTGPLKASNGTVSAPSVTFASDTDTGIYRSAANTLAMTAGGALVATVSATGVDATTVRQGGFRLIPAGAVMAYAVSTAPDGWLKCDGTAVSRTTYADLFTAIGTTYGVGNGTTTFNLPNAGGRVIAGYDPSSVILTGAQAGGVSAGTMGNTGGEQGTNLAIANINSFTPTVAIQAAYVYDKATVGVNFSAGAGGQSITQSLTQTQTASGRNQDVVMDALGSGTAHNNVQPTLILNYIIKT